jgi:hypothetical protein
MTALATARDAKVYLTARIEAQARREGVPLSEVERKMLWFTESGETLPDMKAVSEEFDRTCDQDEYERKVAALIRHLQEAPHSPFDDENWDKAVRVLSEGDHYLLVLIANAAEPVADSHGRRGDRLKLILAGVLAAALTLAMILFAVRIENPYIAKWTMRVGFVVIVAGIALLFNRR